MSNEKEKDLSWFSVGKIKRLFALGINMEWFRVGGSLEMF